jgi:peptidoglycan hydrolase CwlO-like protein
MKKAIQTVGLFTLSLLVFLGAFSCSSAPENMVTQEEYNAVKTQLSAAEAKITELEAKQAEPTTGLDEQLLKDEITSLKAEIESLGNDITALDEQNDALAGEKASLEARYEDLNVQYQELEETLVALSQPEVVTEELVENEILRLIDEERVKGGENKFLHSDLLYKQARRNSTNMAASGKVETISTVFYQEVFFAAGYNSVSTIAHGALLTWKLTLYRFEHNVLLSYNKYGAVGAIKSGDIYYITFLASPYP